MEKNKTLDKSRLGRGLSSLIPPSAKAPVSERPTQTEPVPTPAAEASAPPPAPISAPEAGVLHLPIEKIIANAYQPRTAFDEAALQELTESVLVHGVLQPVMVRPRGGGRYELIAGERRFRAAQQAGLTQIPAVVREMTDEESLTVALIENIQREDLNAIEEAQAYQRLAGEYGHTQDALAKIVHKSRSHVANLLRLLDLPASVQARVSDGSLQMGHARALLGALDVEALAEQVVERGLSVRETEKLARGAKPARAGSAERRPPAAPDTDIAALERQLSDLLGLGIRINHDGDGGSLTITYSTLDQLDMVCQRLTGETI